MRRRQQSILRAIRRGHLTPEGIVLCRPFNNRKPTFGRKENELRKRTMSTIKSDSIILKDEYNNEPVFYCAKCLSLKIRDIPYMPDSEYCDDCGSTHVEQTHIDLWELMYEKKYGHKFLTKTY